MEIDLKICEGFKWYQTKTLWVKGFLFDLNNTLYKEEKLLDYFLDTKSKDDFEQKLKTANGFFCVVIQYEDRIFAAVDCIRSHPLFFSEKYQWVGDHPDLLKKDYKVQKQHVSVREFFATGYVTGNQTIYEDVYQLQAGQYLVIEENTCKLTDYYQYFHQDFVDYTELDAKIELNKCVTNAMKRLVDYANGRQLVIPLSGGYDSRLIVLKLKELKYENVICFTYGKKDNWEAIISKNVADELGYKWIFIDYYPIVKTLYNNKVMSKYDDFCLRGVSLPHVQDFFAVHELVKKSVIDSDALFVPGHSGDFLAGSHLSELEYSNSPLKKDQIIMRIIQKHYVLFKLNKKDEGGYLDKINENLTKSTRNSDNSSLLDCWNWKERQAKFIVNSCRIYEFFGYEWHCPLWDKELMSYFKSLPMKYRRNKKLYDDYVNSLNNGLLNITEKTKKPVVKNKLFRFLTFTLFKDELLFYQRYKLKDYINVILIFISFYKFSKIHSMILVFSRLKNKLLNTP